MPLITFNSENKTFHLSNNSISYIMTIEEGGYLAHLYYGRKIKEYNGLSDYPRINRSFSPNLPGSTDRMYSLDTLLMEYPGFGNGDFRQPAHMIYHKNGTQVTDFKYLTHEIVKGKPKLAGLPATYTTRDDEAETLIITLIDELTQMTVDLLYTIFAAENVITRSSLFKNNGVDDVRLQKVASMSMDIASCDLDLIHFPGTWARERQLVREKISSGQKKLDSKRGSSSHQQNPVIILADPKTTEQQGEAFGFSLVYSGNHEIQIEKDPYQQTRIMLGINSFDFNWLLTPGHNFQTPEVIMSYSSRGLNDLSATNHRVINKHLIRGNYKNQERPILVNNWEATYFDFDEDKIMAIVDEAHDLGIELFVLDDGWFGKREDDNSSLGDWFENEGKLKNGLKGLSEKVHAKGMSFGLWFEPEMISEISELFKTHPEWVLKIPDRASSPSRGQLVLDFSRADVRKYIYQKMTAILDNVAIDYIKWDMNRNMSDVYSNNLTSEHQGSVSHRYMLGLYDLLEQLTTEYPEVLFESCSGGGGRFDAGMLYYMPQTWTSDNTDAIARLNIQYSTSMFYPTSTMGSHVSAIPNHQTERETSLSIRGNVAMSGVFGYELDLSLLSDEEKNQIKEQVAFYKEHRHLLQYGTFIRLLSPYESNDVAWMYVNQDQSEAIVFYFRVLSEESYPLVKLTLDGLAKDKVYDCRGQKAYGDELMYSGFYVDPQLKGDYATEMYHFKELS
ncbi:alpha-galactosidase [Vagococcus vulneris]|uniref:Alpha-galactosidase n=1 Tax=Vagococcus vulneris TaxID=1977869 RepID=A0A429ZYP0_9ENTE|nr:alpha-galactosidase [Vagococcus vulneris]RST99093.1 alpha-galactosidase [Vagococcus vulneris]